MSSYLKRVASRGLGVQAAPVVPLVRSRSPIAEDDQRVGMPGFGTPNLGNAESMDATFDDTGATVGLSHLRTSPPLLNAGGGVVQRKAGGTAGTGDFGTPGSADASAVIGTLHTRKPEADIRASDLSPGSNQGADTIIGPDQSAGLEHAERSRGAIHEIASDTRSGTDLRWVEPSWPSPAQDVRVGEREAAPQKPADGAPALLEPSPRAMRTPTPREPFSSEPLHSPAANAAGPQVVIGRINVEVVPPAAEPKTSTQSRTGPLTAESVSVIGPLTGRVRSSLRLNLKYR